MARDFSSDADLVFAFGVSFSALTSAAVLLATIAVLRLWRRWRVRRITRREGRWRDALHRATEDPSTVRLPRIATLELPDFVIVWNHFQESLKGEAAENLARLFQNHGIDEQLIAMLERRSLRLKLIAITALGHLREVRAWDALARLSQEAELVTSFAAARALLRIDPRRALELLGPSIVKREDWSLARIGSIFQELGPGIVTGPLVSMLAKRPRRGLDRVAKLARFGHRERIAPIVRGWLSTSDDPEVLAVALDYVQESDDLPWARGAARYREWKVRMAAARALGRVGDRKDLPVLLQLLRDPVWWVRYHAAKALTHLHGLESHELETLRQAARDGFASDMLAQAMAERDRR